MGRSRPSFWASSPMEQSPLEVILAMPLYQTKWCPPHSTYQQLLLGSTQESLTLPRLMAKRRAVSLTRLPHANSLVFCSEASLSTPTPGSMPSVI